MAGPVEASPAGIGLLGWLRWAWRQLTSMRTALMLLFLVALAAIPGSMLPQRGQDDDGVTKYLDDHETLGPLLDRFSFFDVFSSSWFAAIYILLFISLAGCVVPRCWQLVKTLRARPPAAPRNLSRLPSSARFETSASPEEAVAAAEELLRQRRYRVDRTTETVAAEKGYLHEAGNMIFHLALLVLVFAVGFGGAYGFRGNVVVTEGEGFSNSLASYDSFKPGREVSADKLEPFSVRLQEFSAKYLTTGDNRGQATDFLAKVWVKDGTSARERPYDLRVNKPLSVGGAQVYLLGHGYAPEFTVKDGNGQVAFQGPVTFLPLEETTYTSEGVIKVPDARPQQLGFRAFFWPTALPDSRGKVVSGFPGAANPQVAVFPFKGDLGLDKGAPQSVYQLDERRMQRIPVKAQPLRVGKTLPLPDNAGSITFTGYKEYVTLQVNRNPGRVPALVAAVVAIFSIIISFIVRRRRIWVRVRTAASPDDDADGEGRTVVEVGGLALAGEHADFEDIVERLRQTVPEAPGDASEQTPGDTATREPDDRSGMT